MGPCLHAYKRTCCILYTHKRPIVCALPFICHLTRTQSAPPEAQPSTYLAIAPQGRVRLAHPSPLNISSQPVNIFETFPHLATELLAHPDRIFSYGPSTVTNSDNTTTTMFHYGMAIFVPAVGPDAAAANGSTYGASGQQQPLPLDLSCTPAECPACFEVKDGMRFWGERKGLVTGVLVLGCISVF